MTREAVFQATGPTSATYSRVKLGAKRDGTITAAHAYLAYEAGAYPGSPVGAGAMCALAPYNIANQVVDGFDVVVNGPKTAAYRAPGAPGVRVRRRGHHQRTGRAARHGPNRAAPEERLEEGTGNAAGQPWPRIGAVEVMETMKSHPHYTSELAGEDVGRGVAVGFWFNGGMESQLQRDGELGRHGLASSSAHRHRRLARVAARCSSPRRSA